MALRQSDRIVEPGALPWNETAAGTARAGRMARLLARLRRR